MASLQRVSHCLKPFLCDATACVALVVVFAVAPPPAQAAEAPTEVVGQPVRRVAEGPDTLVELASRHDLGFVAMRAANPGIDPWSRHPARTVVLPTLHVLPDAPHRGIVVNLAEFRLYYFPPDGGPPLTFPVAIGRERNGDRTPLGTTIVTRKKVRPSWIPTASEHAQDPGLPAIVPPGPDNPMGDYALYLGWPAYAIHGSNRANGIGRHDSYGCVQLSPHDIAKLYRRVVIATEVTVIDQPVKLGWARGELYLEVHPDPKTIEALEKGGVVPPTQPLDIDAMVVKAAGAAVDRVDWAAVQRAATQRDGVAQRITSDTSMQIAAAQSGVPRNEEDGGQ